MKQFRHAWRTVKDVIWPTHLGCLLCEELADDGHLCQSCRSALEQMRVPPLNAQVRSAYRYGGPSGRLVKMLKDKAYAEAAELLAETMAEEAMQMDLPEDTVLTWVSMPSKRRRERGIDHGNVLCSRLGELLDLPVRPLLVRKKQVRTQRGLNRAQRLTNLKGVFDCPEHVDTPVLLIDDVLTTGATISACTNALQRAGAPAVYVVTATRVIQSRSGEPGYRYI